MSSHPLMFNLRQVVVGLVAVRLVAVRQIALSEAGRALSFVGLLSLLLAAYPSPAYGQTSFTLTPSTLTPAAVDSGGVATAGIDLGGDPSVGTVALTCAVTSSVTTTKLPTCLISPNSATPTATLSLTVTTLGASPAGQYSVTVTGTAGGLAPVVSAPLFLNIVEAQQNYTLTVSKAVSPGTITPGGVAQATITISPLSGYSGTVTLSCLSITPTVVASPYCSFQSDTTPPQPTVLVTGTAATATLTINTYGTQQTTAELFSPRGFYALWFGLPGLLLAGAGKRRRKMFGGIMLLTIAGCLLLLPACGGSSPAQNNTFGYITPKNTYTFTITGADLNGVGPSNTVGSLATVSLSVN